MPQNLYELPVTSEALRVTTRAWLLLGLASLVAGDLDVNLVKKLCGLERNVEPLHVLFVGYRPGQTPEDRARQEQAATSNQQ